MDLRITDDAFRNVGRPGLELRLDQHDRERRRREKRERRGQDRPEADEARVAHERTDPAGILAEGGGVEMARIGAFVDGDAPVRTELPGELTVADVDRVDPRRAAVEQHVGEPAGRGADVECHQPGWRKREAVEPVHELQSAARHPGVVLTLERQRRVGGEEVARLVDAPVAAPGETGEDQGGGAASALDQPAFDKELVRPRPTAALRFQAIETDPAETLRPTARITVSTMLLGASAASRIWFG